MAFAVFAIFGAGLVAACSAALDSEFPDLIGGDGSSFGDGSGPILATGDASMNPDGQAFALAPTDPVVTFASGQPAATVQFSATTAGGLVVPASFTIDRGEIGGISLTTGLFTATGNVGGKAKITAAWNGKTASTSITVKLKISDNGLTGAGAGGAGGNGATATSRRSIRSTATLVTST